MEEAEEQCIKAVDISICGLEMSIYKVQFLRQRILYDADAIPKLLLYKHSITIIDISNCLTVCLYANGHLIWHIHCATKMDLYSK